MRGKPSAETDTGPHANQELASLMRAWRRQQAMLSAETARFFIELEITTAQMRVLGQLRRWGRLSGRELAAHLGVAPATVVPLCDRLEELGYLTRSSDRVDRRITWLELAPAGEQLFRRLWLAGGERVMAAFAKFSPEERKTLERLLNQLAEHLEQIPTGGTETRRLRVDRSVTAPNA